MKLLCVWAVFKIQGFVGKRFLPFFPSPSPLFYSLHFRAAILCSRTSQKRLLRRLGRPLCCPYWNLLSRYLQGWAPKGPKKATRFNENQHQYLDNKFYIEQKSDHKADPEKVSRDMRYAMTDAKKKSISVSALL